MSLFNRIKKDSRIALTKSGRDVAANNGQGGILNLLSERIMTIDELAKELGSDSREITSMVEHLKKHGLVEVD